MPAQTKLTEENMVELESRFRKGATILEAIDGIMSESTYHEHRKNNLEFGARMELAKDYITEIARGLLAKRIEKGDVDIARWWLERKQKGEFSLRAELTGKDGESIGVAISANQAEQLIRARAERSDS